MPSRPPPENTQSTCTMRRSSRRKAGNVPPPQAAEANRNQSPANGSQSQHIQQLQPKRPKPNALETIQKLIQIDGFQSVKSSRRTPDGVRLLRSRKVFLSSALPRTRTNLKKPPPQQVSTEIVIKMEPADQDDNKTHVLSDAVISNDTQRCRALVEHSSNPFLSLISSQQQQPPPQQQPDLLFDGAVRPKTECIDSHDSNEAAKVTSPPPLLPIRYVGFQSLLGQMLKQPMAAQSAPMVANLPPTSHHPSGGGDADAKLNLLIRWIPSVERFSIEQPKVAAITNAAASTSASTSAYTNVLPSCAPSSPTPIETVNYLRESQISMDTLPPIILTEQTIPFDTLDDDESPPSSAIIEAANCVRQSPTMPALCPLSDRVHRGPPTRATTASMDVCSASATRTRFIKNLHIPDGITITSSKRDDHRRPHHPAESPQPPVVIFTVTPRNKRTFNNNNSGGEPLAAASAKTPLHNFMHTNRKAAETPRPSSLTSSSTTTVTVAQPSSIGGRTATPSAGQRVVLINSTPVQQQSAPKGSTVPAKNTKSSVGRGGGLAGIAAKRRNARNPIARVGYSSADAKADIDVVLSRLLPNSSAKPSRKAEPVRPVQSAPSVVQTRRSGRPCKNAAASAPSKKSSTKSSSSLVRVVASSTRPPSQPTAIKPEVVALTNQVSISLVNAPIPSRRDHSPAVVETSVSVEPTKRHTCGRKYEEAKICDTCCETKLPEVLPNSDSDDSSKSDSSSKSDVSIVRHVVRANSETADAWTQLDEPNIQRELAGPMAFGVPGSIKVQPPSPPTHSALMATRTPPSIATSLACSVAQTVEDIVVSAPKAKYRSPNSSYLKERLQEALRRQALSVSLTTRSPTPPIVPVSSSSGPTASSGGKLATTLHTKRVQSVQSHVAVSHTTTIVSSGSIRLPAAASTVHTVHVHLTSPPVVSSVSRPGGSKTVVLRRAPNACAPSPSISFTVRPSERTLPELAAVHAIDTYLQQSTACGGPSQTCAIAWALAVAAFSSRHGITESPVLISVISDLQRQTERYEDLLEVIDGDRRGDSTYRQPGPLERSREIVQCRIPLKMTTPHKLVDFSPPSYHQTTPQSRPPALQQQQPHSLAVEKRKFARCQSPANITDLASPDIGHLPCSKRPYHQNEIDLMLQLEADEWQLSDLEQIPMQDLFVAGDDLDLGTYLL